MYQFSRAIYNELSPYVLSGPGQIARASKRRFLGECEGAVERLAADHHYFANPVRTLFNDVRMFFPLSQQLHVYRVVEAHMTAAVAYVEENARAGVTFDGSPLQCQATTRKGSACQRVPLPGNKYCPSHKHLEDVSAELTASAA